MKRRWFSQQGCPAPRQTEDTTGPLSALPPVHSSPLVISGAAVSLMELSAEGPQITSGVNINMFSIITGSLVYWYSVSVNCCLVFATPLWFLKKLSRCFCMFIFRVNTKKYTICMPWIWFSTAMVIILITIYLPTALVRSEDAANTWVIIKSFLFKTGVGSLIMASLGKKSLKSFLTYFKSSGLAEH